MTVPTVVVTPTGGTVPTLADILAGLQAEFRAIYGSDAYLDADSQDGQWLGVLSKAIFDCGVAAGAVYRSFSPRTAVQDALSSNVKINGIRRHAATNSVVDLIVVGQAGTELVNCQAGDGTNKWNLPASVVIPVSGTVTVTAVCAVSGAVAAPAGTVTRIATPTRGWQTVSNLLDATPGAPYEDDAALRVRQTESTALPSLTVLDGTFGAVASVSGVLHATIYENDTNSTDANGLPPHSIAVVADGGDATAIATAIAEKKTPGTYTYGTTSETIIDSRGVANVIRFFRPTPVPIKWAITVQPLQGYTSDYGALIQQSLADFVNALSIGDDVVLTRAYVPANLPGTLAGESYEITALQVGKVGGSLGTSNIVIAFAERATCLASDVALTVL